MESDGVSLEVSGTRVESSLIESSISFFIRCSLRPWSSQISGCTATNPTIARPIRIAQSTIDQSEDDVRPTKSSKTKKQPAKKTKRKSAARGDNQDDDEELSGGEGGPATAKRAKKSTGKRTKKAATTGTKSKAGGSKTKAKNGKGKTVLVKDGDMEISDDNGLFSEWV